MPTPTDEFAFDQQEVLRRAAVAGVEIDAAQLAAVTRQMRVALKALASFDLKEHAFREPANTFDARWK
jgi:hypothetical protein